MGQHTRTALVLVALTFLFLHARADAIGQPVPVVPNLGPTGTIEVTSPPEGAVYTVGSTVPITWKASKSLNPSTTVYAICLDMSPTAIATAKTDANGNGSYNWTVTSVPAGTKHTIAVGVQYTSNFVKSKEFSIVCNQSGFPVSAPAFSDRWEIGSTRNIVWRPGTLPATTPFTIDLLNSAYQPIGIIAQGIVGTQQGADLVFPWTVASKDLVHVYPGTFSIRVRKAVANCPSGATSNFYIVEPGKIFLVYPTAGLTLRPNTKYSIQWSTQAHFANLFVKIDLYRGNGVKVSTIAQGIPHPNPSGKGIYDWVAPSTLAAGSDYYLVLELSGPNAVTVTSTNPTAAGQAYFSIGGGDKITVPTGSTPPPGTLMIK
jgi:hypothetical protein